MSHLAILKKLTQAFLLPQKQKQKKKGTFISRWTWILYKVIKILKLLVMIAKLCQHARNQLNCTLRVREKMSDFRKFYGTINILFLVKDAAIPKDCGETGRLGLVYVHRRM